MAIKINPKRKFEVTEIDREFKAITDKQESKRKAKRLHIGSPQKVIEFPKARKVVGQ